MKGKEMNSWIISAVTMGICLFQGPATAKSPGDTIPAPPGLIWKQTFSAPINSSPVVDGDLLFFGGFDSSFYSLQLSDGTELWHYKTGGEIRSTPAIFDTTVIFSSGDGSVYCLAKRSGALCWKFATKGERKQDFADYYQSSPVISGGNLFFGSGDGNIYAIKPTDGSLIWQFATGGVVHATPAVDDDELFVGSFDGHFYALSVESGALLWKFKSVGQEWFPRGDFQGSPTAGGGVVVVGARDYNLYVLDGARGFCRWNKRFARGWALANKIVDSVLYTGTSDDRLLIAMELASGRELWRTNLHFNIFGGLAIDGGIGYVGTLLGKLYAVDLKSGAERWAFATDGYNANHLKYFKADDSFRDDIFEIVKSDEAFIDVEHEIGAIFSTPALAGDRLVFTSTDGSVYCLKIR